MGKEIADCVYAALKDGKGQIAVPMHANEVEVISAFEIHRQPGSFSAEAGRSDRGASPVRYNRVTCVPQTMLLCPDGPVCVLVKQKKSLIHQTDFLETCSRDIHRSTGDAIESGLDRLEIDGSIDWLPEADQSKARPYLAPV